MKPYFDYPISSDDIAIRKYQKGMMLYDRGRQKHDLLLTFDELFALPYSVYLLDAKGVTIKINEFGANICGFHVASNATGRTIFDVSKENTSQLLLDNCKSVLEQESVQIFDEFNMRFDGRSLQFLSIKFPCYDHNGQLQGTLGISIVLGEHSLADAITALPI
ncbi:MAG: PAS domain-containing protein [Legionellaceae bacterium]|nr:PAS domain-containing protein [Legionellaceae bacterium]